MSIDFQITSSNPPVMELHFVGKASREDYEALTPALDALVQEHGRIRLLVWWVDFEGWTARGLWEDLKTDARHFRDVERMAVVGDERWHEAMALFAKPFTSATVRYFTPHEAEQARQWTAEATASSASA